MQAWGEATVASDGAIEAEHGRSPPRTENAAARWTFLPKSDTTIYRCSHSIAISATTGRMIFGCPILSLALCAEPAVSAAQMWGHCGQHVQPFHPIGQQRWLDKHRRWQHIPHHRGSLARHIGNAERLI
jgi:hypothetical protein